MKKNKVIVWFRQDLRLHDNEALQDALKQGEEVIPIYVFDTRVFEGTTLFGFPKTGKYRTKFIIESVQDLRDNLRALGSELYIRIGKPEQIIFDIAQKAKTSWVFCNRERTEEEVQVQDALEQNLWSIGQEVRFSRGKMLYYTADLPFPVTHTPDVFTHFRKEVERFVPIREVLPTPTKDDFKPLTIGLEAGNLPTLGDFGIQEFDNEKRAVINFKGGETAALKRLHYYFWESGCIENYKNTRNELIGSDYSSKFSPWLSQGCLSPKLIYAELKKYEAQKTKNDSTYWLFFELLWRDFFRLIGKKYDNKIFQKGGIIDQPVPALKDDRQLLQVWIEGRTGVPFIDANMKELAQTGFMSNRGRQNVASFLVKDLLVNWQMGAEYFESLLLDYDPCSNWGNWNYIAGVGSDPRENRYFNILAQAKRYDAKGKYVKLWLPALKNLPSDIVHRPDAITPQAQKIYNFHLGEDYPKSMINTERWI